MPAASSSIELPKLSHILVISTVFYAFYYISWQLTVGAGRRRMIREHGCEPIKDHAELEHWSDFIFGFKLLRENIAATKAGRFLDNGYRRSLRFGNTHKLRVANIKIASTIEPENVKTILATQFKGWKIPDRRRQAFAPLLGKGIFTSDGADWQHSRELLRPNFARSQVADLDTFEDHVGHLIQAIPRDGSTIDLQPLFFRLTIDSATEFLFGQSTNSLSPETSTKSARRFAEAFQNSQDAAGQAIRVGAIITRLTQKASVKEDIKYAHDFVDHYVRLGLARRRKSMKAMAKADAEKGEAESGRYVFLDELVKSIDDPIRLRSEILNILLAGRDTTASLLSNVWFILAKRPDVWSNLRSEVDALSGERPTYEDIKDMKYLRAVLNEGNSNSPLFTPSIPIIHSHLFLPPTALRLYPVVPNNARMAIHDTVLPVGGGPDGKSPFFVPAGSLVGWSAYAMHRRKDFFGEDAEEFRPERWEKLRPGWEYLPFNGGPRICIGRESFSPSPPRLLIFSLTNWGV